jgi:hypothetical protein
VALYQNPHRRDSEIALETECCDGSDFLIRNICVWWVIGLPKRTVTSEFAAFEDAERVRKP